MSRIKIDGQLLEIDGREIAGTFLANASKDPFHHEGVKAYYRRRQPVGLVKVWLTNDRTKFELVVSPDFAAQLPPNVPVTFDFSL